MALNIVPLGDNALLINFQQEIDPMIHQQVMNLSDKVTKANIPGVSYIQPAYCSLTIGYDSAVVEYGDLRKTIQKIDRESTANNDLKGRSLIIPVCYQQPYSLDLAEISQFSGLSQKEIIQLHTGTSYRVYMVGFLPGFPYLGVLPKPLQLPRQTQPRVKVAKRSVGIAGLQTGIYPADSPGGWHILGRTPIPIFRTNSEDPFLFKTGDQVTFQEITDQAYQNIRREIKQSDFDWNSLYE